MIFAAGLLHPGYPRAATAARGTDGGATSLVNFPWADLHTGFSGAAANVRFGSKADIKDGLSESPLYPQ